VPSLQAEFCPECQEIRLGDALHYPHASKEPRGSKGIGIRRSGGIMTSVRMHFVVSSWINSIGYDKNSKALYVRFMKGTLYLYNDVPAEEYFSLLSASSVGRHVHQHIHTQYRRKRIE